MRWINRKIWFADSCLAREWRVWCKLPLCICQPATHISCHIDKQNNANTIVTSEIVIIAIGHSLLAVEKVLFNHDLARSYPFRTIAFYWSLLNGRINICSPFYRKPSSCRISRVISADDNLWTHTHRPNRIQINFAARHCRFRSFFVVVLVVSVNALAKHT